MGNPYMFTGRRWDDETETYYYRFRNYCPMLGRFMQNDPLGYVDGMNSYAYCGNNPGNWVDPMGLKITFFPFNSSEENEELQEIIDELINSSSTGKEIWEQIKKNENDYAISYSDEGNGFYGNASGGGTISIDPSVYSSGNGKFPWSFRPRGVGLGHELIHAYRHAYDGVMVNGLPSDDMLTEERRVVGVEPGSKYCENQIREDYRNNFSQFLENLPEGSDVFFGDFPLPRTSYNGEVPKE
ncbi:MAG: hypothetical protein JEZ07_18765 [Phycisphaerae bacterium]|nr:hypothetical protein [Phycisphaerae bacterium]